MKTCLEPLTTAASKRRSKDVGYWSWSPIKPEQAYDKKHRKGFAVELLICL